MPGKTFLGGLLVALLPFLQRILYLGELYYGRDFTEVFGARSYFYNQLRHGRLILWDAVQATGIPFSSYLFDLFNPLSLICTFLLEDGYLRSNAAQWLLAVHCSIGALGAYWLGLTLNLGRTASVVMGVIMGCCGVVTIKSVEPMMVHTFAWAPFIFLFLQRAREQVRVREGLWAGVFLGLCFMGGHPQIFYYLGLAVLIFAFTGLVTNFREGGGRAVWTRLLRIYLPLYLSFLLTAFPQVLHTLVNSLWAPAGVMAGSGFRKLLVHSQSGSADLSFLYNFLFPALEGGNSESYFYVGILPLVLAWVAVLHFRHHPKSRFWIVLVAVSLILMLGGNLGIHKLLVYWLPGYKYFRIPTRWSFLVSLGLLVLAGFGVTRLLSSKNTEDFSGFIRGLPVVIGGLFLTMVAVLVVRRLEILQDKDTLNLILHSVTGLLLLSSATWIVFRRIQAGENGPGIRFLIVAIVILDLAFYHPSVGVNLNTVKSEQGFGPDPAEVTGAMDQVAREIIGLTEGKPSRVLIGVHGVRTPWERNISQSAFYRHRVNSFFPIDGYPERLHPLGYWQMVWNLHDMPRAVSLLGGKFIETGRLEMTASRKSWDLRGFSQAAVRLPSEELITWLTLEGRVEGLDRRDPATVVAEIGIMKDGQVLGTWPITKQQLTPGGNPEIPLRAPLSATEILLASTLAEGKVRIEKLVVNGNPVADSLAATPVRNWLVRNEQALPLAFFVSRAAVIKDQGPYLEALLSEDPSRCVLFRETPPGFRKPDGLTTDPGGAVKILGWEDQEVRLQVEARRAGYLVMTQAAYPGWTAWVDGKKVPILKAYGFLTALPIGPGVHTVRFTYREPWVVAGLIISPLWILGLCLGTIRRKRK